MSPGTGDAVIIFNLFIGNLQIQREKTENKTYS